MWEFVEIITSLIAVVFAIAAALGILLLFYGIAIIIFRSAFGVELWNPLH
jgi:hypothetical protein